MKNIPNVSFQDADNSNSFECLNLTNFFSRIPEIEDHNPTLPHRIHFFALLMVTEGNGTHQVDLIDYKLNKGTVLKLAKGQVHAFQKNATYKGFLVLFTEEFVMNHFSKSSINIISHLYNYHVTSPISSYEELNNKFLNHLNLELANSNSFARNNIIAALLDLYLLKLERKNNENVLQNNSKNYAVFISFKNQVEENYIKTRNVKDYAKMLSITTKNLNEVVKEFTLDTAKTFIDNYVILEAKRAIVSTDLSFKEIAFELGFDELTNFTKFFKNKVQLSPKAFKNK
ncbi:helix-turn-helix domain-containing protein [Maribacter sp. SA7]|uniref:helix-turn-helix domain-containing protein n=1 Tax=Maribacter zhoushanensis TaxID=3030012 RepID=UPI0023EC93A4|nr:helix-turn-helix domain-containing protein [Maribacter zhoushanensis]MDF4203079.1 helix-turn-helix domain-containing protein [Maribacter zhoushanensis]